MAQTRKRRRTKHRGNAAGVVEVRGRTGRRPSGSEPGARATAQVRRQERRDRPPTWRAAINRAAISALVFVAIIILVLHQSVGAAVGLGAFVFVFYIPLGYYTDVFVHRRRQARRGA